jgi:hypothetical protein
MTSRSRSGWPPSLVRYAELIGDAAALKLVASYGGTRLYVAKSPRENSALARAVGWPAARRLARAYGGDELDVPRAEALRSKKRAILAASGSGREVARAVGTTERHVRRVRNAGGRDRDERQHEFILPGPPSS